MGSCNNIQLYASIKRFVILCFQRAASCGCFFFRARESVEWVFFLLLILVAVFIVGHEAEARVCMLHVRYFSAEKGREGLIQCSDYIMGGWDSDPACRVYMMAYR